MNYMTQKSVQKAINNIAAMRVLEDINPEDWDFMIAMEAFLEYTNGMLSDSDYKNVQDAVSLMQESTKMISSVHKKILDDTQSIANSLYPRARVDPLGLFEKTHENRISCKIDEYWVLRNDEKCKR